MPTLQPTLLAFHKVQPSFSYGVTNYSPAKLERLIGHLVEVGYAIGDTSDKTQPELRLSFDDGYAHLRETLPRIIAEYKTRPIIFVPTDWINRSNRWDYSSRLQKVRHLSRDEIRRLAEYGVEFGSHGASHTDLTACNESQLVRELRDSRRLLQDITGQSVTAISYPFGRYSARVTGAVEAAGYKCGYTMRIPLDNESAFATGRVPVYSFDSPRAILRRLQSPADRWERLKTGAVNRLSLGTVWLNRLRDIASKPSPEK